MLAIALVSSTEDDFQEPLDLHVVLLEWPMLPKLPEPTNLPVDDVLVEPILSNNLRKVYPDSTGN